MLKYTSYPSTTIPSWIHFLITNSSLRSAEICSCLLVTPPLPKCTEVYLLSLHFYLRSSMFGRKMLKYTSYPSTTEVYLLSLHFYSCSLMIGRKMLKYTSYPSTTAPPLFICARTVVWQPPFYGNHYLFLRKQKACLFLVFVACLEKAGWVESLEIGRFGNRLFNAGSGAVFRGFCFSV